MSKKAKKADAAEHKRHDRTEPAANTTHHAADDRRTLQISRAIADPTRFNILRCIAGGNGRCSLLRESLAISAATLSHHMKELEMAGIIVVAREGRFLVASLDRKVWKHYIANLKALT